MARCVWALESEEIVEHLSEMQEETSRGWLAHLIEIMPHTDLIRVLVTMWAIRYARRKAIYENIFQSLLSTHSFINKYIAKLQVAKPNQVVKPQVQSQRPQWLPPPAGCMKVNVDATISKNMKRASVVAIAQDQDDIFLGALGVVLDGITKPEIVEEMACKEGLALAADLMLTLVRLASDCANAIRSLEGRNMGPYGQIVKEIQTKAHDFLLVNFVHENKKSNVDAHTLAMSLISFNTGRHV
jgi:hypothetical protein